MEKTRFKSKKLMLATWACNIKDHYQCIDWIPIFKKIFGKVIVFSLRDNYFRYGKPAMNQLFLEKVQQEKPDYLYFNTRYDEIDFNTITEIKRVSPHTKTIYYSCDDEWRYSDWSRFYSPLFDYIIVDEKGTTEHEKDGLRNFYFINGVNPERYKPVKAEKKYDVVFIGMPIRDRADYIRFLKKSGVKIKLFGKGWDSYPDLKDIWGGYLPQEDYLKTISQARVNLSFSKGMLKGSERGQIKGRPWETLSCKSFILIEYFKNIASYFKDYRQISFKDKKELLEKINYYLKHEKEREKLTEKFHKIVLEEYSWEVGLKGFFNAIANERKFKPNNFPELNKYILCLNESDWYLSDNKLTEKVNKFDYISFSKGSHINNPRKDYLQIYSIEKSGLPISCCDYNLAFNSREVYAIFQAKKAFNLLNGKDFHKLLNINQFVVKREYLITNIKKFRKLYAGSETEIVTAKNTTFVSFPLVNLDKIKPLEYSKMKDAFYMTFRDTLYSFIYNKKRLFSAYPLKIFLSSFSEPFIFQHLFKSIFNKDNWDKLTGRMF